VCAAGADVDGWFADGLVVGVADPGAAGIADVGAAGVAEDGGAAGIEVTDVTAGGLLKFAWLATATVPAMVKNDATLSPPSNQRVAAAGCPRRGRFAGWAGGGVVLFATRPCVALSLASGGVAMLRVEAARRSWS
jgi:hypothetical protein